MSPLPRNHPIFTNHPFLKEHYGQPYEFIQDERLRSLYNAQQIFLHDLATDLEEAYEKGIAEGIANAKAEGNTERVVAIAQRMKAEGFAASFIVEMTGLPLTEIEQLN